MLPRSTGLVPEIKAPAHLQQERAAKVTSRRATSIVCYPLLLPSHWEATGSSGTVPRAGAAEAVPMDTDTRLFSFVAGTDSDSPPCTMQTIPPALRFSKLDSEELLVEKGSDVGVDAEKATGSRSAPRRRTLGEPARLTYIAHEENDKASTRLSSVTLPEYDRLVCILLKAHPTGTAETNDSQLGIVGTPLARPIMELRRDRTELLSSSPNSTSGSGISTSWYSNPSSFNKSDWKSMDALDRAGAAGERSRWEMDVAEETEQATVAGGGRGETTRVLKRQREASKVSAATAARMAGESLSQRWSLLNGGRVPSSLPPPPPPTALPDPTPAHRSATAPQLQPVLSLPETIAAQGEVALQKLREEGRRMVLLKDLEKIILKNVPEYASMAEKSKDVTTRGEAVRWFKVAQQELKLWLVSRRFVIDPTGIVRIS